MHLAAYIVSVLLSDCLNYCLHPPIYPRDSDCPLVGVLLFFFSPLSFSITSNCQPVSLFVSVLLCVCPPLTVCLFLSSGRQSWLSDGLRLVSVSVHPSTLRGCFQRTGRQWLWNLPRSVPARRRTFRRNTLCFSSIRTQAQCRREMRSLPCAPVKGRAAEFFTRGRRDKDVWPTPK